MFKPATALAIALSSSASMCGGPAPAPQPYDGHEGAYFSCDDYQLMLDVEVELAQECTFDWECGQVLADTGCDCEDSDLLANSAFDTQYFHGLYGEALDAGCVIDFEAPCDCNGTIPVCRAGACGWD